MRWVCSWLLYGCGHVIYLVFDRWFPLGMTGPIYSAYNRCMTLSWRVQGRGKGAWRRRHG